MEVPRGDVVTGRKRPNLVLVLTDQLRADALGAYGGEICRTPRLDALAAEGARFSRAYTSTGLCSPARASMLTGKYAHRHGVINNVHGRDALQPDLGPDHVTLSGLLQRAGYRTAHTGKWHVGRSAGPRDRGFDDVLATDWLLGPELSVYRRGLGLAPSEALFDVAESTCRLSVRGPVTTELPAVPMAGLDRFPLEATLHGYHLDCALRLLRQVTGSQPFFLVLSFVGPHWPHFVPEPYWSMYPPGDIPPWPNFADDFAGKPRGHRRAQSFTGVEAWSWSDWQPMVASYFASVTMHDELIGRFLDALSSVGLAADTLVAVTADHGDMCGSHGQFNKGPLMYDEVYRIPLLLRWPGVIAPGTVCSEYAGNLDLMATFLEAAGVDAPAGIDSRSLLGPLRGDTAQWRTEFFAEYHGDEVGLYSQRMLHADRHKLVYNPHDVDELYDLENDPGELRNLAEDAAFAGVKRELELRLYGWMERTGDPLAMLPAEG